MSRRFLPVALAQILCCWLHLGGSAVADQVKASGRSRLLFMRRNACSGFCSAYSFEVFDDGEVVYQGRKFVLRKGRARAKLNAAAIVRLQKAIDRLPKSLHIDDRGSDCRTDAASVDITASLDGREKRIHHYLGCERGQNVIPVEDSIDEIVGTVRWVGTDEQLKAAGVFERDRERLPDDPYRYATQPRDALARRR